MVYHCIGDYFCLHSLAIFAHGRAALDQDILNYTKDENFFRRVV